MSITHTINPYSQLQENPRFTQSFMIADMQRLKSILENNTGEVQVAFTLQRTEDGVGLQVQAVCDLQIQCQRCMEPMDYTIDLDHTVLLVQPGFNDTDFDGDYTVLDDNKLSLQDFFEDELLLALPIIAKHNTKTCFPAPEQPEQKLAETYKPFANLKELHGKIRD